MWSSALSSMSGKAILVELGVVIPWTGMTGA